MMRTQVLVALEPDLSVGFAGIKLPNPTILASGILGASSEIMIRAGRAGRCLGCRAQRLMPSCRRGRYRDRTKPTKNRRGSESREERGQDPGHCETNSQRN